jgi:purine-nucleoside phosphorylase
MNPEIEEAAAFIRSRADRTYAVGVVLGSGLGRVADLVTDPVHLPYEDVPGFPVSKVSAHKNELIAGFIEGVPVVILSGRSHYFETGDAGIMRNPLGTLKALGCDTLLLTNAAGSLRKEVGPGEIMLIADHINLTGRNPLIGEPTDARFVGMTGAYDAGVRAALLGAAEREGVAMTDGVYMWFSGPSFETPAEIRMARLMGADAVGMSTVPEVILGRFFGLRCAAISSITNFAAGMTGVELSHEETKRLAPIGAAKMERVIRRYLRDRRRG